MGKMVRNGHEYAVRRQPSTVALAERTVMDTSGNNIESTYLKLADFRTRYGFNLDDDDVLIQEQPNAGFHNSLFRGADITSKYTDGSLYTNIANGTFADLYVGDYFKATINGREYTCRIAGFDIYYNNGDTAFTDHHAVIVTDERMYVGDAVTSKMNSSNTTTGGYVGSAMYTTVLPTIDGYLDATFGNHLKSNRELLSKAVGTATSRGYRTATGQASDWGWYTVKSCLMTEVEVYGSLAWTSSGYDVGTGKVQLPLFAIAPEFINPGRFSWWLRSVVSSASFAYVFNLGNASYTGASYSIGVRPRFLIG